MRIAVASGKGGTGKTTVSANLALTLAGSGCDRIQLLDCDVEEPNLHLFLPAHKSVTTPVNVLVPNVDNSRCDGCGKCSEICAFNAIVTIIDRAIVFKQMCHSCGGCRLICPRHAITEVESRIGEITSWETRRLSIVQGRLDVGMAMAPPLIKQLKDRIDLEATVILDAPPGTSCPVMATIRDCDRIILVTEPTPFGLHDLKIAADVVSQLKIPAGVVLNRAGSGDGAVKMFCEDRDIPVLVEIPDDRRIARAYSEGRLIVEALPEYSALFEKLGATINEGMRILR